ncbi:hypothetical protein DK261_05005 [Pseudomonas sp. RW409]|nr:hypothetical protein DK261_05005 [Pseudomonas sp. RW409]
MKNFLKSGFMAASAKGGPIPPLQERSLLAMNADAVLQALRSAWIAGKPRSYRNSACRQRYSAALL